MFDLECVLGKALISDNNQRAKFYRLTPAGMRKLTDETSRWDRFVAAVTGVLRPAESEES